MDFDALEVELSVALARRSFRTVKQGYDREEVDAYLSYALTTARQLLTAAGELNKEANALRTGIAELRGVVNTQQATIDAAESELARLRLEVERRREEAREAAARAWALQHDLDAARAEIASLRDAAGRDGFSEVGEEVAGVLRAAHEAAAAIRAEAERGAEEARRAALAAVARDREEAERVLAEARREAERLVDEARREADELVGAALARTEQLAEVERQLRDGLTTAAKWVLDAVNGSLGAPSLLPPDTDATPTSPSTPAARIAADASVN
jgi:cell division septum initiation protein DivIVA